jgi:hypothetical protein
MSGEDADKQRRRELRLQAARDADKRERRARLRRVLAPCAAITVAMGALAYAALSGGGAPATPAATGAQISAPFGQHYPGLVARRERAHVPTMMQTMSSP